MYTNQRIDGRKNTHIPSCPDTWEKSREMRREERLMGVTGKE
jgi:hypothetical protein